MIFDKREYWRRRKHVNVTKNEDGEITSATPAPLRGQTSIKLPTKIIKESGVATLSTKQGPIVLNRRTRRLRNIDRKFTKKGYAFGIKKK